ncbi:hypothetical protein V8G54_015639 [Vigna mungo]|uniref:Uncharacterized protein n=1 Tax=Vigna mungo TaxID=3915 RepID=A0AAQ3RX12_VIGMU
MALSSMDNSDIVKTVERHKAVMEESEKKEKKEEKGEQVVWSWGAGTEGQLGTKIVKDELFPQLLHQPSLSSISSLACGSAHLGRFWLMGTFILGEEASRAWKMLTFLIP